MQKEVTLFQYLYDTLTAQIRTGRIQYGECLPSINKLCGMYEVGIRTVKDVLKVMKTEGYITVEPRKPAVVSYRPQAKRATDAIVADLLPRKKSIIDAMYAMTCLFPHIISSGAALCSLDDLDEIYCSYVGKNGIPPRERWCANSSVVQKFLSFYGNPFLSNLFEEMDIYLQVDVVDEFDSPFADLYGDVSCDVDAFFGQIRRRKYDPICLYMENLFTKAYKAVKAYLNALAAAFPQFDNAPQSSFEWRARKGRDRQYLKISREIALQVIEGAYPDNTRIPTIFELAAGYGVSPTTVGKALGVLNSLGLVETVNGRGSLVTLGAAKPIEAYMRNDSMRQKANECLCAIHLCVLICKTVALLGFEHMSEAVVESLEREMESKNHFLFPFSILDSLVQVQPCAAIRTIYEQVELLRSWGHCFVFTRSDRTYDQSIRNQSKEALQCIRRNDKHRCASILQNLWIDIFIFLRNYLMEYGLESCKTLRLPLQASHMGGKIAIP